MHLFNKDYL